MKAIMVMFDSLNRHMLPSYGCDWVHAPNFARLAERSVTFDQCWVGSMPCVPARRELHTGRTNFLHRSWGPLEPFDDSMPALLKQHGVHTHLASDHYHYWEAGGATYHTQYSTWEFCRGQEGDPWKGDLNDYKLPVSTKEFNPMRQKLFRQDWVNRHYMNTEELHPQSLTFDKGLEFLKTNAGCDDWFLQIEAFDPHEPYFSPERFKTLYPHPYNGPHLDWPLYEKVKETNEQVEHVRAEYAALLSMCDEQLGRVLDMMDAQDLWKDTLLIVNTDHGFLLGERGWWGKNVQPFYNEIARIPLFIWDPRSKQSNRRNSSLVQMIDMAPTLLDYFEVEIPEDMQGVALGKTLATGSPTRDACLFGMHGAHVNCTDGRYVYMRAPEKQDNQPLYEYTLMPAHMNSMFSVKELQEIALAEPFSFTKGVKTMQIPASSGRWTYDSGTQLYDLDLDPEEHAPIHNPLSEQRMIEHMIRLMNENDAPAEQYERLGLLRGQLQ